MAIKYKVCPECGSKDVLKIVYGMPSYELFLEAEKEKVKLGGCCLDIDNPEYYCKNCGNEWNKEEVIDKQYNSIERIKASIGGYFGPEYNIEINLRDSFFEWIGKESQNSVAKYIKGHFDENEGIDFIDRLKVIHLLNWKRKFVNSEILDGTSWSIEITKDGKLIRIHGINAYPKEWDLFCNLIQDVTGKSIE